MDNIDLTGEEISTKQQTQDIEEGRTSCAELSLDNGTWLEMEYNNRSPVPTHQVCKRPLVSLHVTLEDPEHECNFTPSCKKQSVHEGLKHQNKI
jgi:hypothetical protein